MSSGVRAFALAVATALVLAVGIPDAKAAVGPELLMNTAFSQGTNPQPQIQQYNQPLLPVGWTFEGAAGLFDHTATKFKSAPYSAAISAPASGPRKVCQGNPAPDRLPNVIPQTCPPLDATASAKDTVGSRATSITPAWRPQNPVSVTAGKTYQLSAFVMWELATAGLGGAWVRVRWVDANGVGISQSTAISKIATVHDSTFVGWTAVSGQVKAPAGAVKAIPLFGAHDDAFITQVAYDDVSFRLVL